MGWTPFWKVNAGDVSRGAETRREVVCFKRSCLCLFFIQDVYPRWLEHGHIDKKHPESYYSYAMDIVRDLNKYLVKDNDPFQLVADDFTEVLERLQSFK